MSESATLTTAGVPTVYFIDDSATMREVIKIAFKKENIQVVTCPDAATAIAQFDTTTPNAVITDVIMPDKDGYEVCQFIKQHEKLAGTPVILMSGVVNRAVAEKAMAVRADELIRKPFQPQDLIARVKNLLNPKAARSSSIEAAADESSDAPKPSSQALSGLFSPSPASAPSPAQSFAPPAPRPAAASPIAPAPRPPFPVAAPAPAATSAELHKLRNEVRRLELLVKKLRAELDAEHKYCEALESHFKTQQDSE
jgi:CheY-like chemotaxis protein